MNNKARRDSLRAFVSLCLSNFIRELQILHLDERDSSQSRDPRRSDAVSGI